MPPATPVERITPYPKRLINADVVDIAVTKAGRATKATKPTTAPIAKHPTTVQNFFQPLVFYLIFKVKTLLNP